MATGWRDHCTGSPAFRTTVILASSAIALALGASSAHANARLSCTQIPSMESGSWSLSATEIPATAAAPAHCAVTGSLDKRTGVNGLPYAINFLLNMPDTWNGRFYFEGGGGTDGSVPAATGNTSPDGQPSRLAQGYAVVDDDSGHSNTLDNLDNAGGVAAFGTDPQARIDYGYRAIGVVDAVAKSIVALYYGASPKYSYFDGCSNGGREAMMVTQRHPLDFDGVLAGDPGFNLPRAAVAEAWNDQAVATAATSLDKTGAPYLPSAFSTADLGLAAAAINAACDKLDGVADGMISNQGACTNSVVYPVLQAVRCTGAKTASCLSGTQLSALKAVFGGVHNGAGQSLYSDFQWDSGLVGPNAWPSWNLGSRRSPVNDSLNITVGAGALPLIFMTPPVVLPTAQLADFVLDFNFDTKATQIYATNFTYPQSSMQVIAANDERLDAFRSHGGKLLIYHGGADPVFSPHDTARWLDGLNKNYNGTAANFVRLFRVPGMGHCGGGPATSAFDAFGTLVDWVEKGNAPDTIIATAPAGSQFAGRTRPLCSYPAYAVYNGHGDIEAASSFRCVAGPRQSNVP